MKLPDEELALRKQRKDKALLAKAYEAVAWGAPDQYSIGYSRSELTNLIRDLIKRIEELEKGSLV